MGKKGNPTSAQSYSPSQATSSHSEDEIPLPPTSPRKKVAVLKGSQAKKMLQSFKSQKLSKVVKGRTADIFAEDDDETPPPPRKPKKIETKTEIKLKEKSAIASIMETELGFKDKDKMIELKLQKIKEQLAEQLEEKEKKEETAREEREKKSEEEKNAPEGRVDGRNDERRRQNREGEEDLRTMLQRMKKNKEPPQGGRSRRDRDPSDEERRVTRKKSVDLSDEDQSNTRKDRSRDGRDRSSEGKVRSKERRARSRDEIDRPKERRKRSSEGRDRSREGRDRPRERKDISREGRDRSREGKDHSRERRGRSLEGSRSREGSAQSRNGRDRSKEGSDRSREGSSRGGRNQPKEKSCERTVRSTDDKNRSKERRGASDDGRERLNKEDRNKSLDGKRVRNKSKERVRSGNGSPTMSRDRSVPSRDRSKTNRDLSRELSAKRSEDRSAPSSAEKRKPGSSKPASSEKKGKKAKDRLGSVEQVKKKLQLPIEEDKRRGKKKPVKKRGRSSDTESPEEEDGTDDPRGASTPLKKKKKRGEKKDVEVIQLDTSKNDSFDSQDSQTDHYTVKLVSPEDHFHVKGCHRDLAVLQPWLVTTGDSQHLRFPSHSCRRTVYGEEENVSWSVNPGLNRATTERERLLRASVDSALSELENEMRAKSQEEEEKVLQTKASKKKKKKDKKIKQLKGIKGFKGKKAEQVKEILELLQKKKKRTKKTKKLKTKAATNEEDQDDDADDIENDEEMNDTKEDLEDTIDKEDDLDEKVPENPDEPVPEMVLTEEKHTELGIAPQLSKAGMSKLFELAGYKDPEPKPKVKETEEESYQVAEAKVQSSDISPPKPGRFQSMSFSSPEKTAKLHGLTFPEDRSPSRKYDDKLTISPDSEGRNLSQSTVGDTSSPLHHDDEVQSPASAQLEEFGGISFSTEDRATPVVDEMHQLPAVSPRLPVMRDSRSPNKGPIMRDRRSPLRSLDSSHNTDHGRVDHDRGYDNDQRYDEVKHSEPERGHGDDRQNWKDVRSPRRHYSPDRLVGNPPDYEQRRARSPDSARPGGYEDVRDHHNSHRGAGYHRSPRAAVHSPNRRSSKDAYGATEPGHNYGQDRDRFNSVNPVTPNRPYDAFYDDPAIKASRASKSPGRKWSPVTSRGRSPVRGRSPIGRSPGRDRSPYRARSPYRGRSPGKSPAGRARSPGRGRSPDRGRGNLRGRSPGRGRSPPRRGSPGRHRSPARARSPGGRYGSPYRARSPVGARSPGNGYRRDSPAYSRYSPRRDYGAGKDYRDARYRSPGRQSPAKRLEMSPRRYSPRRGSPGRFSPRRGSPGRFSPRRSSGRYSPARRPGSPRRHSPGMRFSPSRPETWKAALAGGVSPGRDGLGRGSEYASSYRSGSPRSGRYSPIGRLRGRSPSPRERRRSPLPSVARHSASPSRSHVSPRGAPRSPVRDVPADSTIPDGALNTMQPPPQPFSASKLNSVATNSPQRISLDERLEKELGIKVDQEQLQQQQQQQQMQVAHLATGLPTTIPTYDNTPLPSQPLQKMPVEKEQAMAAAQMVTTKLMEMQAAKEAERQRKREQRMAERMAQMAGEPAAPVFDNKADTKVATGRILEQVEMQEQATEEKMQSKKKKKEENGTPTLITLKPFYRPHEKKGKKKKPETPPQEDWNDYTDVPRSPVPLPDRSTCKSVLVELGFGVSKDKRTKKSVKYKDGVLPGQKSPDHSARDSPQEAPQVKRYKKVKLRVVSYPEEDPLPPPPPPPGSPPRYSSSELIAKYGQPVLVQTNA